MHRSQNKIKGIKFIGVFLILSFFVFHRITSAYNFAEKLNTYRFFSESIKDQIGSLSDLSLVGYQEIKKTLTEKKKNLFNPKQSGQSKNLKLLSQIGSNQISNSAIVSPTQTPQKTTTRLILTGQESTASSVPALNVSGIIVSNATNGTSGIENSSLVLEHKIFRSSFSSRVYIFQDGMLHYVQRPVKNF